MLKHLLLLALTFGLAAPAFSKSEKSSYTTSPNYNFRFSPLPLLIGGINIDLDMAITPEWTLGPELVYLNYTMSRSGSLTKDISAKAYSLGVRGNWYKNGVHTDGLYLSPALTYANVSVSSADASGTISADGNGIFLKGIAGYGWFWDSFNILLGGGLSTGLGSSKVKVKDSTGTTTQEVDIQGGFAAEFTLGWTF